MTVVIMKFGGSCLVDNHAFNRILEITKLYKNEKKVYVTSALKGITALLLETALNLESLKKVDNTITLIEKRHIDTIEKIFDEDSIYLIHSKDWVDKKLSELEDIFEDIKEFGLEPYYKDYVLSFGEMLSTYILNQFLLSKGVDSIFLAANA